MIALRIVGVIIGILLAGAGVLGVLAVFVPQDVWPFKESPRETLWKSLMAFGAGIAFTAAASFG